MAGVEGSPGLRGVNGGPAEKGRHRVPPATGRQARANQTPATQPPADIFTRFVLDYAAQHPDRAIMVLQAGSTTAGQDLDLAALRDSRHEIDVTLLDDDVPAAREAVARRADPGAVTLGDLRSLPMAPRSFDIAHCSMLLDRITNSEVVLGRLVAALKPGGLLLLRTTDRQTAAAFIDRKLPESVRAMLWRSSRPGQPGPYPAIYEPLVSADGIQSFFTRHGLAVAHRQVCAAAGRPPAVLAAHRIVAWLSRGRLDPGHDELRYVVRKPVDRFARVL